MLLVVDQIQLIDETLDVIKQTSGGETLLTDAAVAIGNHFLVDVCSIYLLEQGSELVLRATVGLLQDSIGNIKMVPTEGLVGLVAESLSPVAVPSADKHPRFKYFPQAGEEVYESFLGAPMMANGELVGVIVLQTADARTFEVEEQITLAYAAERLGRLWDSTRPCRAFSKPFHRSSVSPNVDFEAIDDSGPVTFELPLSFPLKTVDEIRSCYATGVSRNSLAVRLFQLAVDRSQVALADVPLEEAKRILIQAFRTVDAIIARA